MPAKRKHRSGLKPAVSSNGLPVKPTLVVGAFKGGAVKTATAVALAARLAWTGSAVLLLTADRQLDARFRMGIPPSAPRIATVKRGAGRVTLRGASKEKVVKLVYRDNEGQYDAVVVDTAPTRVGGNLPGVFFVGPVSNEDGARTLALLLRSTPPSAEVMVWRFVETRKRVSNEAWARDADRIEEAAGRQFVYYEDPVHFSDPINDVHAAGKSVWTLPRRGNALAFLNTMDDLATVFWKKVGKAKLPQMPVEPAVDVYVPGWSGDE